MSHERSMKDLIEDALERMMFTLDISSVKLDDFLDNEERYPFTDVAHFQHAHGYLRGVADERGVTLRELLDGEGLLK